MRLFTNCFGFLVACIPVFAIIFAGEFACNHVAVTMPFDNGWFGASGSLSEIHAESEKLNQELRRVQEFSRAKRAIVTQQQSPSHPVTNLTN